MASVQNVYLEDGVMGQMAWREVSALHAAVIIGREKIAVENIAGTMDGICCGLWIT